MSIQPAHHRVSCPAAGWFLAVALMSASALAGSVEAAAAGDSDADVAEPVRHSREAPVLHVGRHSFSERDLALKRRQIRWQYGDAPDGKTALAAYARLIKGYVLVEVLARADHPITRSALREELARIDEQTKRPRRLQALKGIFAQDSGTYADIAILPRFANSRYFYEVFPRMDAVQASRKRRAAALAERLAGTGAPDLAAVAEARPDWRYRRLLFQPESGFLPWPAKSDAGDGRAQRLKRWRRHEPDDARITLYQRIETELLTDRSAGEVIPEIIEFNGAFALLQSLGWHDRSNGVRLVGRLTLSKVSAHAYLRQQAAHVSVSVEDPAMRRRLKEHKALFKMLEWRR